MTRQQRARFREALARKARRPGAPTSAYARTSPRRPSAARRVSRIASHATAEERSLVGSGRPQDVGSPREKSTGKGKQTTGKWNQ